MTLKDKYQITQGDNNLKGICGFTTMSQLIIDYGKITLQDYEKKYGANTIKFAKEWIDRQLAFEQNEKKKGEVSVLDVSLAYTRAFKGYENFLEKNKTPPSDQELIKILEDPKQWDGLALVPEAILQYLLKHYNIKLSIFAYDKSNGGRGKSIGELWTSTSKNLGHGIYGLKLPDQSKGVKAGAPLSSDPKFKGQSQVAHYVYIDKKGNLMTWGSQNGAAAKQGDALKQIIGRFGYVYVKLHP